LRALFQCDGTVNISGKDGTSCSVRLASSHPSLLKDVQMLLSNFGVFARVMKRREAGNRLLPDGKGGKKEYACKADYELIIDGESREYFMAVYRVPDRREEPQVREVGAGEGAE
jgi:ribonucleoside-diphosphate reductase alpha chain